MAEERKGWLDGIEEYPFDFERYIEERLREIDDLDERRFAKKILLDGLGRMIQCVEQKYKTLEQRICGEVEPRANQYETVITIVQREHYDPTNRTLYPVDERDLENRQLLETLSGKKEIFLETFFLEADDRIQKEFQKTEHFYGRLKQKECSFSIKPAKRYRDLSIKCWSIWEQRIL